MRASKSSSGTWVKDGEAKPGKEGDTVEGVMLHSFARTAGWCLVPDGVRGGGEGRASGAYGIRDKAIKRGVTRTGRTGSVMPPAADRRGNGRSPRAPCGSSNPARRGGAGP